MAYTFYIVCTKVGSKNCTKIHEGMGAVKEEKNMANNNKPKKVKPPIKQAHFACEVILYEEFEKYCYGNGKSVSEALRAYMKICLGK